MNSTNLLTDTSLPKIAKARKVLDRATQFWFLVAVIGQWIFVYYIIMHYGVAALQGDVESWNEVTIAGHVEGDMIGNIVFAVHILMAVILTLGGTLQLVPQIRQRAIAFHRWNGRIFILIAALMAIGGLYLIWGRGSMTTFIGSVGTSLNALLMLIFSYFAVQKARQHQVAAHRRWALRAYLMANGVWFFRIGMMAWFIINQGPAGSTENLDGPFDMVWAFANFLLPLAVLELYLKVQEDGSIRSKYAMAAGLTVLTIVMAIGIFGAYMFMWEPNI